VEHPEGMLDGFPLVDEISSDEMDAIFREIAALDSSER
jgi:hypothetical protein